MRVAIVNDTDGPHFGCQLVMRTFREQLERVGVELLGTVPKSVKKLEKYPAFVGEADLVVVNGEGSIHHGARGELVELAGRYPAVLLNCVYQENELRPELQKFLLVTARESRSAEELRQHGVDAEVVPDLLFGSKVLAGYRKGEPHEELGISDDVFGPPGYSALVGPGNFLQYLEWLSGFKRLCLGRFHAVAAASVLQIPFAAWASNTHKTIGMLEDMGVPHLFAETREEALPRVPYEFDERIERYVIAARKKIDALFERLVTLV